MSVKKFLAGIFLSSNLEGFSKFSKKGIFMLSAIQLTPDDTFDFLLNVAITRPVFYGVRRVSVKVRW